jgi:hypothetical protein
MKIKLLKQIRQQVANKYQVIHAKENDGSYKWRIQCGPQTYLAYCEWDEREKADEYMIYLSYDIDANDPSFAPGTGTPEAFGLNSIKLMNFIKVLFKNLPIKVMDIVEISPVLDTNNITSWLALKTIYEVLGLIKGE